MTKEERKEYEKELGRKRSKKYNFAHPEKVKEQKAKYRRTHKERIKAYRLAHKQETKEYSAKYRELNKEKIKGRITKYSLADKEEQKIYQREYHKQRRLADPLYRKEYNVNYRIKHKEEIKERGVEYFTKHKEERKIYEKRKRLVDPLFKMKCNLRKRTCYIFNKIGLHKSCKTETLLGVDFKTVMQHIESQFIFGMTWKNYGEWHIDHKKPLALAKTEKQLIKLCHYTNLQPLWEEENFSKHNKTNYVIKEVRFG